MKVIRMVQSAAILLVATCFMTACSGGGGSSAPSGSTTVTTGEITGFGSVIVNGIKFSRKTGLPDDKVKLRFENNTSATEDKLRVGMIVTIKGAVNTSNGTGEYESIEFRPEVRGPLDDNGVDLVNNKIRILGRDVQVDANTHFDSIRDIAEINGELLAGRHPELEISGSLDNGGVLHATRIGRKSNDFTNGLVELKGTIAAGATVNGFSIGTRAVVVDNNTVFANMARTDIAAGLMVEVKGNLNAGVLTATRIEKKLTVSGAQVEDNVRIKGSAVAGISNNSFSINGPNGAITVTTNASTVFARGGTAATSSIVTAGARLEVEGALQANGSVLATKVSLEVEKTVKLEGNTTTGATATSVTLNGVTTAITPTTRLIDADGSALNPLSIAAGNHLQIAGVYDSATGKVTASQINRTSASNLSFVQGPVTAVANPRLTLIGVITVDTGTITQANDFQDDRSGIEVAMGSTLAASRAAFFAALTTDGLTVVKARGTVTGTTLSADEVELEQVM